jgi:hypothetical protein
MSASQAATFAAIACAALALSGCDHDRSDRGPVQSETRDLGSFNSIEMKGAAKLEIVVGEPVSVVITGRESAVRRVETHVRGDTLHIKSKPRDWIIGAGTPHITLQIKLPKLESLRVEGGNDVELSGFDGGDSNIRTAGAAHIKAKGRLRALTVRLSGAGHADLSELIADDATVTVDGVGSVIVHPRDKLDATMNGVGAILYVGTPRRVSTRLNGLGTIEQGEPKDKEEDADAEPQVEKAPPREADPEKLQPERDDKPKRKAKPPTSDDVTEVI